MPPTKLETLLFFEGKKCICASVFLDHHLMSGVAGKKKATNLLAASCATILRSDNTRFAQALRAQ
jgi:hypothetical protein